MSLSYTEFNMTTHLLNSKLYISANNTEIYALHLPLWSIRISLLPQQQEYKPMRPIRIHTYTRIVSDYVQDIMGTRRCCVWLPETATVLISYHDLHVHCSGCVTTGKIDGGICAYETWMINRLMCSTPLCAASERGNFEHTERNWVISSLTN